MLDNLLHLDHRNKLKCGAVDLCHSEALMVLFIKTWLGNVSANALCIVKPSLDN